MKTVIVTRHNGLLEWLERHHPELTKESEVIETATPENVAGRLVVGNLPLALAASARVVYSPTFEVPPGKRGTELTAEELEELNCHLEPFVVFRAPEDYGSANIPGDEWLPLQEAWRLWGDVHGLEVEVNGFRYNSISVVIRDGSGQRWELLYGL